MESLFKVFRLASPTVTTGDDEIAPEVEEPPDDRLSELNVFKKENVPSRKTSAPAVPRRESLLTRGLHPVMEQSPSSPRPPRGLSTTSSHSFASTAELTSDLESPVRSASPSPPPPLGRISFATTTKPSDLPAEVIIAPVTSDDKPTVVSATTENDIEKLLGRRRCIMFACKDPQPEKPKEVDTEMERKEDAKVDVPVRKCKISFACPTKPVADAPAKIAVVEPEKRRRSSPGPISKDAQSVTRGQRRATEAAPPVSNVKTLKTSQTVAVTKPSTKQHFHEFGTSHNEHEEWVAKSTDIGKPKLTIDDCFEKENAIRKIVREAEEEAEAEERELDHLENEASDSDNNQDDFAPSDDDDGDDDVSDGGNESDDENGFAASDDESDAESEYQFWAPSTVLPATSADNGTHFSFRQSGRSRSSSTSSARSASFDPQRRYKRRGTKPIKMRPGTPELPDSTDFVCGTFDEDRPLEAAYISCRDQKRQEKHKVIPQDIDPSFPTSDPDNEDEDDEEEHQNTVDSEEQPWIKDQFEDFDEEVRGRRASAIKLSPLHSPNSVVTPMRSGRPPVPSRFVARSPPPPHRPAKSPPPKRTVLRSPPPPKQRARSPAPRLFDRPTHRMRSPAGARLKSPRGSPTGYKSVNIGITVNHLAQRPIADKTASLPRTPNPFFKDWQKHTSTTVSRVQSLATSPGNEDQLVDMHVRGPVDIVIGLEKKRQKRKEKYWRQHCRKNAKAAEKRPPQGKGVERMKELGLECAERFRGYGVGQQTQLVLSV